MINTRKNIISSAVLASICILTLYFEIFNLLYWDLTVFPIIMMAVFLVMMIYFARHLRHRVRIIDLKEKHYPLDMNHNDEREWRLMLTATYVSQRITLTFSVIVLTGILGGSPWLLSLSAPMLMATFSSAICLGLLLMEWSYVIVYFKLDR